MNSDSKNTFMFWVDTCVYPYRVLFAFGGEDLDIYNELRGNKVKKIEIGDNHKIDNSDGFAMIFSNTHRALVRLKAKPNTSYLKGVLAHEIEHVSNDILTNLGLYRTNASEEAFTYLTGYLTSKVYENLKRKR